MVSRNVLADLLPRKNTLFSVNHIQSETILEEIEFHNVEMNENICCDVGSSLEMRRKYEREKKRKWRSDRKNRDKEKESRRHRQEAALVSETTEERNRRLSQHRERVRRYRAKQKSINEGRKQLKFARGPSNHQSMDPFYQRDQCKIQYDLEHHVEIIKKHVYTHSCRELGNNEKCKGILFTTKTLGENDDLLNEDVRCVENIDGSHSTESNIQLVNVTEVACNRGSAYDENFS